MQEGSACVKLIPEQVKEDVSKIAVYALSAHPSWFKPLVERKGGRSRTGITRFAGMRR